MIRRRFWIVYVVVGLAIAMMPFMGHVDTVSAADIASGESGTCEWVIDEYGNFTVSPINGDRGELGQSASQNWYKYSSRVKTVSFEGHINAKDCRGLCSFPNAEVIDLTNLTTVGANTMIEMFAGCSKIKSLDLSGLDTSKVTCMARMFYGCSSLTQIDMSQLDMSRVKETLMMFSECSNLKSVDISGVDLKGADVYTDSMLDGCVKLDTLIVGPWDMSKVPNDYWRDKATFPVTMYDITGKKYEAGSYIPNYKQLVKYYSFVKKYDSGFTLGKDSNSFYNGPGVFKKNGMKAKTKFFSDNSYDLKLTPAPIMRFEDEELFKTLLEAAGEYEKNKIQRCADEEITGICYGASSTMALIKNGQLDVSDVTSKNGILNYFHLPKPKKDDWFSDVLKYYHLQQYLSSIAVEQEMAIGEGHEDEFEHALLAKDLPVVLKDLVDATREAATRDEVILLGYGGYSIDENKEEEYFGHRVLITGLTETSDEYILNVYDLNVVTPLISILRFKKMVVSADYQSFELPAKNQIIDESSFGFVRFMDSSDLLDLSGKRFNHSANSNIFTADVTVASNTNANVLIDNKILLNKQPGRSPEVPIKVFSPIDNGDNTSDNKFIIDDYNSCCVENNMAELDIDATNSKGYMSLQGENIDSANLIPGETMEIRGDSYAFEFTTSTNHKVAGGYKGMISISGTAEDDIDVSVDGDEINVKSDGNISNIVTTKYVGPIIERDSVVGDVKQMTIDDAFDWAQPTYEWKSDYSSVKATRVSLDDPNRIETETVKTSKSAEDTSDKNIVEITYTAAFANPAFGVQSQVMDTAKLKQPMKVKAVKKTVKAKKLKKKAMKVAPLKVTNAKGTVTYKVIGGNKKSKKALKINTKTGKVTVKKKTKKGTYKVKVKVTAAGKLEYKAGSKSVYVTVKVK